MTDKKNKKSDKVDAKTETTLFEDMNVMQKLQFFKERFKKSFEKFVKILDKLFEKKVDNITAIKNKLEDLKIEKLMKWYAENFNKVSDLIIAFDNDLFKKDFEVLPGFQMSSFIKKTDKYEINKKLWKIILWEYFPYFNLWSSCWLTISSAKESEQEKKVNHAEKYVRDTSIIIQEFYSKKTKEFTNGEQPKKKKNNNSDDDKKDSTNEKKTTLHNKKKNKKSDNEESDSDNNTKKSKDDSGSEESGSDNDTKKSKSDSENEESGSDNDTKKSKDKSDNEKDDELTTDNLAQRYQNAASKKTASESTKGDSKSQSSSVEKLLKTSLIKQILKKTSVGEWLQPKSINKKIRSLTEEDIAKTIKKCKEFLKEINDDRYLKLFKRLVKVGITKILELKEIKFKTTEEALDHIISLIKEINTALNIKTGELDLRDLTMKILTQVQKNNKDSKKGASFVKIIESIQALIQANKKPTAEQITAIIESTASKDEKNAPVVSKEQINAVIDIIERHRKDKKDISLADILELVNLLNIDVAKILPRFGFGDSKEKPRQSDRQLVPYRNTMQMVKRK